MLTRLNKIENLELLHNLLQVIVSNPLSALLDIRTRLWSFSTIVCAQY